jgi:hypothetical protein|tara:strand:- start:80 stop:616 length:537 start_codon:yes stop_codon:yes gene_type:complete
MAKNSLFDTESILKQYVDGLSINSMRENAHPTSVDDSPIDFNSLLDNYNNKENLTNNVVSEDTDNSVDNLEYNEDGEIVSDTRSSEQLKQDSINKVDKGVNLLSYTIPGAPIGLANRFSQAFGGPTIGNFVGSGYDFGGGLYDFLNPNVTLDKLNEKYRVKENIVTGSEATSNTGKKY